MFHQIFGRAGAGRGHFALLFCFLTVLSLAAMAPVSSAQAGLCGTTQNVTVQSGGTSVITCSEWGFIQPAVTNPSHGSLTFGMPTNTNALIYTNNGDGATSDSFVVYDESPSSPVTFNVTVAPSSSPLTVTPANLPTPVIGVAYIQTLNTTGGTGPYTYALSGGTTLPPGLTLSAAGVISGTPTGSGPYNFIVRVTDSTTPTAHTYDKSYNPTIAAPVIDVTPDSLPDGGVGAAYSVHFSASGGTPPYTYTLDVGTLPTGLSLSTSGQLSGAPTTAGSFNFKIKIQDSTTISTGGVHFVAQNFTTTINSFPPVALSPASGALPAATVGSAYSQGISASGGAGAISYAVTAGSLPAGLALNTTTGAISGTPTAAAIGTANFTVTATAATSGSATANYSIAVSAPPVVLTPASNTALSGGTVGVAYSNSSISATGGVGAITYSVSAGALPAGLTINPSTGAITGTPLPDAYGSAPFTVTATAANVGTDSKAYSITIAAPPVVLTPAGGALVGGDVNVVYPGASISASGGLGTFTYTVTAGALPDGLSLSSAGAIAGTPTAAGYGTKNFTITATGSTAGSASAAYSIAISAPPMTLTPAGGALTAATAGTAYSDMSIAAVNGLGTVTYSLASGTLPPGLGLASASGAITGTPAVAGAFSFTITATDMHSRTASESYSINVVAIAPDAPTGAAAMANDASARVSFSAPAFNGGSSITGYTVTASPGGVTATGPSSPIDVTGLTNGLSYTFTVAATNLAGTGVASGASNAVTPKAPQTITFANPGSQTFGTTPTLTATASSSLPVSFTSATAGVCTIDPGGKLAFQSMGTCTIHADQTGDAATEAAPRVSQSFIVNAVAPAAPTGVVATAGDSQAMVAFVAPSSNGGALISRYVVTSSPDGLTGDGTSSPVVITGLTNGTSYTFTVVAENNAGPGPASAASNAVTPRTIQTITFANPGAQSFGTTPTLSASSDSGLTVSFTSSTTAVCTISPAGLLTFVSIGTCTINADQAGDSTYLPASQVSRSFVVNAVVPGAPSGVVATAGNASAEVSFVAPVNTGGAPITGYTVTASPGGLTETGPASPLTVVGLTNGASYTFTVTAANSSGPGIASGVSNAVTPKGSQTISFANPGPQDYATPVNLTASASSGLPVAWQSMTPSVCVVTSSGAVTFRNGGDCEIEVSQAGNGAYLAAPSVRQLFQVSAPNFVFTPASGALPTATAATAYSQTFSVSGGTGPHSYTVVAGSLPNGLVLSSAGALSGTPTVDGSFNFTVSATDTYGASSTSSYGLIVRVQAPIAGTTTITVAANSTGNVIAPNLSGGAAASLAIVSAPSHGTATVAGTSFHYTPAAGFSGTDSFSYSATNATGTSAPATVTVTVSPPIFSFTPAPGSFPGATVAEPYDQTITAANGTGPYSYTVISSALPAGLTLAANGRLSGTPTVDGNFNFTIEATDANGATGSVTYSLAVAVEAPSAGAVALTVAANSTANVISPSISGGAAASLAIASPPSRGNTSVSGLQILYTPQHGYSGTDSFTYTATNATGTSTPATVTVTVSPPVLVFSPTGGTLAAAVAGVSYSQSLTASAGTAPYLYQVTSGALPGGLTLDPVSGAISGRPGADGDFAFTVTATDANGATGQASYRIAVVAANIVFSPAAGSLPDAMVGEAYSAPISASGGSGALIYSVKSGTLPKGMVLNVSTGELTGPLAADAVPDTYRFTIGVVDSRGASGSAAYTLKLNPRAVTAPSIVVDVPAGTTPNNVYLNAGATGGPFTSAAVASVSPPIAGTAEIIEGELAAAGSFTPVGYYLKFTPNPSYSGSAVVTYTLRSALGTSGAGTVTYKISLDRVAAGQEIDGLVRDFVRNRQSLLSSTVKVPGLIERRRAAASTDPVTTAVTPSENGARLGFSTSLTQVQAARDAADAAAAGQTFVKTDQPFDVWMDGSFLFHKDKDDDSDKWGNFALFSVGADYLISERALVGLSFHYDYTSDPTDEDAELTGNGWLAGPYASFEIGQGVFLDANLLYGGSSNDIDTGIFTGTFDTTRWMADVKLTGEWQLDEITVLTPKLRAVYFNEEADDYSVENALGETIDLKGFIEEQARFSIGFDVERTLELENGVILSPTIGADLGFASLDGEGLFGRVSAGLTLSNNDNWDLDFSLLFNIEGDGSQAAGAKVGARVRF
ncbi:putative Ig domain-containing protein [Ensifer adhaerens]|uniref:Ig domain-containing protein n=1 Tax=Ensifer adhaerens TaxID=106592 RepID=A0A9Q8YD11_ENSAD|nr:putative Ig domain-containing protein [Ensifer adhaerens]USJ25662.1 putative Ig domain-containing protein [Ensifer adhaerens]UTV39359.1 putative Ig domain-containing protein [Ensifer adhaerens]